MILNKEEFFEGFDNPSLQKKVVGIKIALLQNDNGEIGLGLGIEAPPLHSREIEEINRFFAKKYNADEMMQKLLQHYQDQRSQNADSKSQSDRKYEITDIAHPQYPWLHRIRALQDVREDVHQGDLGGFVESERNLSQEGSCWIYDNALAGENSRVIEQSTLHWACRALGSSIISGDAPAGSECMGFRQRHRCRRNRHQYGYHPRGCQESCPAPAIVLLSLKTTPSSTEPW